MGQYDRINALLTLFITHNFASASATYKKNKNAQHEHEGCKYSERSQFPQEPTKHGRPNTDWAKTQEPKYKCGNCNEYRRTTKKQTNILIEHTDQEKLSGGRQTINNKSTDHEEKRSPMTQSDYKSVESQSLGLGLFAFLWAPPQVFNVQAWML